MNDEDAAEYLDRGLMLAGFDAIKLIGGQELLNVLTAHSGGAFGGVIPEKVPVEEYCRYRDTAIEFFQESFRMTAFQTGRLLMQRMGRERGRDLERLLEQFKYSANKLPVIGQASVLASTGNPGRVIAELENDRLLAVTIENCPECRGLTEQTPFCYLNQGLITEFAESFLGIKVQTKETKCRALGDPACRIEVAVA
jgi:predicted hydrocarbon binding protein